MMLAGRVAIVTGGAQGIGRAIAQRFCAEGARVVVADIDAAAAGPTIGAIEAAGGQAIFVRTDVADPDDVSRLIDATLERFQRLDILVNNAGIAHGSGAVRNFLEMPEDMWQRLIAVHLHGLLRCCQSAARVMVRQARGGAIINMSSGGATRAHRMMVAYDMTKGGIEAATRALALDLAPWRIRVNAIVPGIIAVETRTPVGREASIHPGDVIPLGRLGSPEDVAGAAAYLASDDAQYVTGHSLFVDGGLTVQLRSPIIDASPDADLLRRLEPAEDR